MFKNKAFKKIAVTGTKGKTTVARLLDLVLLSLSYKTLRVDTDGHYVNGKQKSNYFDSRKYWGMTPNNCPGKYLYELKKFPENYKSVAILEAAIGSSSLFGLGYAFHDIGIITNIYEDHITNSRIKNKDDIYNAKRFIFTKTSKNGFFIFNSDDDFLTKKIAQEKINSAKIAVGKSINNLKEEDFLESGGIFIKIEENILTFRTKNKKFDILNFKDIPFSFDAQFEPNVYNISFVIAALICLLGVEEFNEKIEKIKKILKQYRPCATGGRLVFLKNKKRDVGVWIDFAHEKESFKQIALLARKYSKNKVLGVLRIDPSRTDEDIEKTAAYISEYYDFIYIYDKVDGVCRNKSRVLAGGKIRGVGETANLFATKLKEMGYNNFEIILEKKIAIKKAYLEAKKGDIIVYIGDGYDHKNEYSSVKKIVKNNAFLFF